MLPLILIFIIGFVCLGSVDGGDGGDGVGIGIGGVCVGSVDGGGGGGGIGVDDFICDCDCDSGGGGGIDGVSIGVGDCVGIDGDCCWIDRDCNCEYCALLFIVWSCVCPCKNWFVCIVFVFIPPV